MRTREPCPASASASRISGWSRRYVSMALPRFGRRIGNVRRSHRNGFSMNASRTCAETACCCRLGAGPRGSRPKTVRYGTTARTAGPGRSQELLVKDRLDLGVVDVRLVVPEEPRVDRLRHALAVDGLDRRRDALLADADRVLGDRAEHQAAVDGVDLGLARVVAHDGELALHVELVHGVDHADR